MKKNIVVLSGLVVALSIVQSAWGMEETHQLDVRQLLTANGLFVAQVYQGITEEGAFRAVEHLYQGQKMDKRVTNTIDGILVKTEESGDEPVGILAFVEQIDGRKLKYPGFQLYPVGFFLEGKKQKIAPVNDAIFQLCVKGGGMAPWSFRIVDKLTVKNRDSGTTKKTLDSNLFSTLNGNPINMISATIAIDGLVVAEDNRYSARMISTVPRNLVDAILVKEKGRDGVAGVVAKRRKRDSKEFYYQYFSVGTFFGETKDVAIDGPEVKTGTIFNLVAQEGGGVVVSIKIVSPSDLVDTSVLLEEAGLTSSTGIGFSPLIKRVCLGLTAIALLWIVWKADLLSKINFAK